MADRHGFPAPGSTVAGAPPPLKRTLTAADGVAVATVGDHGADPAGSRPLVPPVSSSARFTTAAALLGVALGLELARLWTSGGTAHIGPKY
ncbi:hypothetical protein A5733_22415 [Mycobacterium sp. NS-7484]|nr:hypothetical protein A5733_22415 [Mycobacterium sp. NS-7484]